MKNSTKIKIINFVKRLISFEEAPLNLTYSEPIIIAGEECEILPIMSFVEIEGYLPLCLSSWEAVERAKKEAAFKAIQFLEIEGFIEYSITDNARVMAKIRALRKKNK